MAKSVYLSPSMQENNRGAGNFGTEEYRMNQVADVVQRILLTAGVTVYRNKPEWTLKQMVNDSNAKNPNIHFAIHSNAGGGRGCEVYCYSKGSESERLAKAVYAEVEPLTPTSDRGVKIGSHLYEIRKTVATAALIEIAFHDNADDAAFITNNIETIGTAIARGILKYFGMSMPAPAPSNPTPPAPTPTTPSASGCGLVKGDKVKVINAIQYNGQPFTTYYDEYNVISVDGDRVVIGIGSTVTAAVNAKNLTKKGSKGKAIVKGGKVKVKNAIQYNGQPFKAYYTEYDVIDINGDRVIIGIGKTVTAAVKANNLIAV